MPPSRSSTTNSAQTPPPSTATLGGGAHGHLAITVSPTIYGTLSAIAFAPPTNPNRPDLTSLTAPQISAQNRVYNGDRKVFKEYNRLQTALKKQLIATIKPIYMKALKEPYVEFGNRTVYAMIQHLYNTYAKISLADLKTNADAMSKLYDPNEPFEALIQQVQEAVDYADHRGAPFTQEQILNTAYNLSTKQACLRMTARTGATAARC